MTSEALSRGVMGWAILQRDPESFTSLFSVTLKNQPVDIASGDGALLIDRDGLVNGVVRIYRIRRSIGHIELHFDVIRRLDTPVDIASVATIDAPDPIAPIYWDIFNQVVRHCCGDVFEHLPLIGAKKDPHEQAHLRELLQLAVMDDLLGPAGGPEEQIVGMGVRDRYLVGRLAPKDTSDDGRSAIDPDEQPENSELLIKEGHQDQGDLGSQSGNADPDEQEFDASTNQSLIPSSFGLTCCIDGAAESIEITAHWGRYRRTPEDDVEVEGKPDPKTGEKKITRLRTWRREPMGGTLRLTLPKGSELIPKQIIDSEQEQVFVQGAIRKPLPNGDRLLTLFLINGQSVPEENPDEAWVFQPEIRLKRVSRNSNLPYHV